MLVMVAVIVGIGGGLAGFMLIRGSMSSSSDVGKLEALAPIQAQLRPLDACSFRYNTFKRTNNSVVVMSPCDKGLFPTSANVPVPANFKYRTVKFEGKRSSKSDPWQIEVSQTNVAFPDLLAALTELAPVMAQNYAPLLVKAEAEMDAARRQREEAERARQKVKETYPTK